MTGVGARRMHINVRFATACCLLLFASISVRRAETEDGDGVRLPVGREEIRRVLDEDLRLRNLGEPMSSWEFEVPSAVPALASHKLEVSSVCRDTTAGVLRFRLACQPASACLPFLVHVRTPRPLPAPACQTGTRMRPDLNAAAPLVRPGDRVTAVLLLPGLRLYAPVISMGTGAAGDIVHVRGQEGRVFFARVGGHGWVEAMLQ
jgi:Chaperone for flagella basal body P-ring formation